VSAAKGQAGTRPQVVIHTDGGCQGNPGVGAWAWVIEHGEQMWEWSGGVLATTNNRMELQAAIKALKALNQPCEVEFHTDSSYLRQGITKWVAGWKRNGWRTQDRQPVKNQDQWQELEALAAKHRITWKWLKGHAGHELNERCDRLANDAMAEVRKKFTSAQLRTALAEFTQREAGAGEGLL
jgi:ribonuclease HI